MYILPVNPATWSPVHGSCNPLTCYTLPWLSLLDTTNRISVKIIIHVVTYLRFGFQGVKLYNSRYSGLISAFNDGYFHIVDLFVKAFFVISHCICVVFTFLIVYRYFYTVRMPLLHTDNNITNPNA